MINAYRQTKTINELYEIKNQVDFDLAIQRSDEQWDIKRRSLFVYAMIYGYPTNKVFSIDRNGKMYQILEGKQRFKNGIFDFIDDKYELDLSTPDIDNEKIAGKKFSQLSERMQKKFLNKPLEIDFLKDPTDKEVEEFFRFINNGVPLSSIQIIRVLAGEEVMNFIREINGMKFFQETIPLPEKSRKIKNTDEELILKILALVYSEDPVGFSKDDTTKFAIKLNEEGGVSEKYKEIVRNITKYLGEAMPDKFKTLNKVHIPLLYKMAIQAIENDIPASRFGGWVQSFFAPKYYKTTLYKELARSKTADKSNVTARLNEMQKFYDDNIETAPIYRKPTPGTRGRKPKSQTTQPQAQQQPQQQTPNIPDFPSMSNQITQAKPDQDEWPNNEIKQEFPPDDIPDKEKEIS